MFELPSSVQFGASLMASKRHHPQSRGRPLAAQRHACRGWSELSLHFLGVTHVLTGQLVSSHFRRTRSIGGYPHREEAVSTWRSPLGRTDANAWRPEALGRGDG